MHGEGAGQQRWEAEEREWAHSEQTRICWIKGGPSRNPQEPTKKKETYITFSPSWMPVRTKCQVLRAQSHQAKEVVLLPLMSPLGLSYHLGRERVVRQDGAGLEDHRLPTASSWSQGA